MQLILASSSPYRKELLDRLAIAYQIAHPNIDETAQPGENAYALVKRLALCKAQAVAEKFNNALIIGCDQVATFNEHILGKPKDHADAVRQLRLLSNQSVVFLSALCLYNSLNKLHQLDVVPFCIDFRKLSDSQIENYLRKDKPYHCAASIKSERLGIALFAKTQSDDATSILGLPLIRLVEMLRNEGVDVLG
jgi:MAF protein